MPYAETRPPPDLSPWIDRIATSCDGQHAPATPIRVLPNGRGSLLFSWSADGLEVEVVGPHTRPLSVWDREPKDKVEVRVRPGALTSLLHVPADELTDATTPIGELGAAWGRDVQPLESLPDRSRLAAVETWLRRLAPADQPTPSPALQTALRLIERSEGRLPVRTVAERVGVSERTLTRHFRRHVGLGPKVYTRWVRVDRALHLLRRGIPASQCALRGGFADQSHLSREIKRWTGQTPGRHAPDSSRV